MNVDIRTGTDINKNKDFNTNLGRNTGKDLNAGIDRNAGTDLIKKENRERNYLFDNIKAILIFSVVLAHYFRMSDSFALDTFGGTVYVISFSYIMQGFLFISGYFSRNLDKCRETAFQTFLFPYFVLMTVMFSIRYLIFGRAHLNFTLPTMALWYLLTLFYYRFLAKDLVKKKNILRISIMISLAAGFVPFLDSTLSLGRTFSFLPFFLMGYYFREEWIKKLREIPKSVGVIILAGLLCISAYIAYTNSLPLSVLYMKASYEATGLSWYEGIGTRTAVLLISAVWILVFINLVPSERTFLTCIGQNTMTVYILHIIIRYIIKYYGAFFGQDIRSYFILTGAAILSLWLFSRPAAVKIYKGIMNTLYRWIISNPLILNRQIG